MDLLLTSEQEQIVEAIAAVLGDELPLTGGHPRRMTRSLWQLASDLGWIGLGLPMSVGGMQASTVEEALLFHKIGYHCGPMELLFSVIAAHAAKDSNPALCERLVKGEARAGYLIGTSLNPPWLALAMANAEVAVRLDANDQMILHGAVPLTSHEQICGLDPAVDTMSIDALPQILCVAPANVTSRGLLLVAAMEAGLARLALDLACEHAKVREQFGKAIGSFQAVRHACADMAVRSEAVDSQLAFAAASLAKESDSAFYEVRALKCLSIDAAYRNVRSAIQIFGAIGVTDEHVMHLLLKRTHLLDALFGNRSHQLDRLLAYPFPDS